MNSTSFHRSQISLLKGDGSLEPLHLHPGPFRQGFIVLARERCLFERMDAAPGLKTRAAEAAARLHADTGAPYSRSGALITAKGGAFGIWWWDAAWVGEKLGALGLDPNIRIVPEPLVRASAEGWRIVRGSSGYEAQRWQNGYLIASQWRRAPFDAAAWQDFTRVQGDQAGADTALLTPQDPPYTLTSPYYRTQLSEWTPDRMGQMAAAAAAVVLAGLSLYLVGEWAGLRHSTKTLEAQADALKKTAPAAVRNEQQAVSGLVALKSAVEGPNPMVMLQSAQQIVQPHGYKLVAFDAGRDKVRIVLPKEAVGDIDEIAAELAASPYFTDIKPALERRSDRLTIDMRAKGAPKPKARARTAASTSGLS
jgi:hypothetical protein